MALLLCAQSPPSSAEPVVVDGEQRPYRTETSSRFLCGELTVEVRLLEQSLSPDAVSRLADALRVTLLHLSVSGRAISPADRARAEALIATFAWVDDVGVRCFAGRVQISIVGMPKQEWIDFIEERAPARPRARMRTIEIAREGTLTIDGRGF